MVHPFFNSRNISSTLFFQLISSFFACLKFFGSRVVMVFSMRSLTDFSLQSLKLLTHLLQQISCIPVRKMVVSCFMNQIKLLLRLLDILKILLLFSQVQISMIQDHQNSVCTIKQTFLFSDFVTVLLIMGICGTGTEEGCCNTGLFSIPI